MSVFKNELRRMYMQAQSIYVGEFRKGLLPSCWASCLLELEDVVAEGLKALEAPVDPAKETAGGIESPR